MRAFVVTRYGPQGLHEADVSGPSVGPTDVLVDVKAASINPLDTMVRNGEFKQLLKYNLPFVLGHDLAGTISQVGEDVPGFSVGDEVFARPRDLRIGAFAESIAIDAEDVALKPATLSFDEAAAVPLVALAAWQALVDVANVQSGQRVLIHAGAGGLGSTAIQVAKHLGAHVATTVRASNADKVRALGADEVIDFTTTDVADVLNDYDVVLDSLGAASLNTSFTLLKPGGLAMSVVGPPDPPFARQLGQPLLTPVLAALSHTVRRRAKKRGVRYSFVYMQANGQQLSTLAELYDNGTLRPVLDRTFSFDDTLEAMAYVEQGKANGKIVITQ